MNDEIVFKDVKFGPAEDIAINIAPDPDPDAEEGYIRIKGETGDTMFEGKQLRIMTLLGWFRLPARNINTSDPYAGTDTLQVWMKLKNNKWYQSTCSFNPQALTKVQFV